MVEKYSYDPNNKKLFDVDEIIQEVQQGKDIVDGLWVMPKVAIRIRTEDITKGSQLHETICQAMDKLNNMILEKGRPTTSMSLSDWDGKEVFTNIKVTDEYRQYAAQAY